MKPQIEALRIAILSREYPPETGWGGIGTYTFNLAQGLSRAGHRVHVVAGSHDGGSHRQEACSLVVHRVPLRVTPRVVGARGLWRVTRRWESLLDRIEQTFASWRCVRRIRREEGLDVVEFPDWWGEGFAGAGSPTATVARIHSYLRLMRRLHNEPSTPMIRRLEWIEERALAGADVIAPNTRWIAEKLAQDHGFPVPTQRVLPMGIDAPRFAAGADPIRRRELRRSLGLPEEAVVILSCGRLEPRKGFERLITALAAIRKRGAEAFLVVAGRDRLGGREAERLKKLIAEQGVESFVRLPGHVDYMDLPYWYGMADVYAGASCGESPGLTYLEAMMAGKAIVAYDDGAVPEVVPHGRTGLLVKPGDEAELEESLHRLTVDADLRRGFGQAGQEHVRASFSMEAVLPRHLDLYREAIALKGGASVPGKSAAIPWQPSEAPTSSR